MSTSAIVLILIFFCFFLILVLNMLSILHHCTSHFIHVTGTRKLQYTTVGAIEKVPYQEV